MLFSTCSTSNIVVDGVTVAKSISLKDKFENLGARYVLLCKIDDVCADASLLD